MKRHNIDTENDDLIQIDLNDTWNIQDGEEALLTLVRFDHPNTKQVTLIVKKNDLIKLRDRLNMVLDEKSNEIYGNHEDKD